ncbi:MAG: hypothetical protein ABI333_12900 [bacterium]
MTISMRRSSGAPGGLLALALTASVLALGGCSEDEVITPTRYLERPNAVDFFCVGPMTEDGTAISGLPAHACYEETAGYERRLLFGLVTNSARSEVAMVDITDGRLVDLADQNPGYGFVPVGESPVALRITEDGCAGYVANHGSCDISVININRTLSAAGLPVSDDSAPGAPTGRISLQASGGRLLARPHALVLRPEFLASEPPIQQCTGISGHRAFVSLPACGLVAEVDLDSGRILQSLRFEGGTVQAAGIDPRCPAECFDWQGGGVTGGELAENRPGPLEVTWDGLRLIIGSITHPTVTIVDLDIVNGQFLNPRTVTLADEERGVRRIRQSPYTVAHDWHFFYVVSRSGVIHVLDADLEEECETNPDPQDPFFPKGTDDPSVWEAWEAGKGCLRLSDANTPERAPGVESPAILMPNARVAVDAAFIELDHASYEDTSALSSLHPAFLGGTFAYAVTMDGLAYLINVDEIYPTVPDEALPDKDPLLHRREDGVYAILSHQFRSSVNTLPEEEGRPRPADDEDQELYLDDELLPDDELSRHDHLADPPGDATGIAAVTDPYRALAETWTLTYMGALPRANRTSGQVIRRDLAVGVGPDQAEFRDAGLNFCWAGVRDGDVVELLGCSATDDCAGGYYCYRSFLQPLGTDGICLAEDAQERLETECWKLAVSPRQYNIARAEDGRLVLEAREVVDATECDDADYGGLCCLTEDNGTDNPVEVIVGVLEGNRCLAGPLPDAAVSVDPAVRSAGLASCFEGLLEYRIRVTDDQYLLTGTRTGTLTEGIPDPTDSDHCVADPDRHPLLRARVPRTTEPFRSAVLRFSLELAAGSGKVLPTPDYRISFRIEAGFAPQVVDVSARLPATVETGPDGQMYIIDQGDENINGGLQGQVLRLLPGDIALDTSFVVR